MRLPKHLQLILEQGISSGTGFLVNIGLVKLLSLADYGRFASLVMVAYLLLSVVHALVVQPMQVHVSQEKEGAAYRSVLLLVLAPLLLLFVAAILGVRLADPAGLSAYTPLFIPFAGYVAAFLSVDFLRKYFLARGQTGLALTISGSYSLCVVAGLGWAAYAGVTAPGSYLWLLGGAYLPGLLLGGGIYVRRSVLPDTIIVRRYLRVHLYEGQWLLYAAVVQWMSSNLYVMTSGLLIGIEALGVLRFVQTLLGPINIVLQTLENYVLPRLSAAYATSVDACYRSCQQQLGRYQLAMLAGLAVLYAVAGQVITLVGDAAFAEYTFVLRGMVLLYAVIVIAYPIRLLIRVTELNKSYFTAYLISFLVSAASYQFLLGYFGVAGAIVGLLLNQLILQLSWLLVLSKKQFNVWKLYIS